MGISEGEVWESLLAGDACDRADGSRVRLPPRIILHDGA